MLRAPGHTHAVEDKLRDRFVFYAVALEILAAATAGGALEDGQEETEEAVHIHLVGGQPGGGR